MTRSPRPRGHENILKRVFVHAGAFNLGLWMRTLFGVGTPHSLQGRVVALGAMVAPLWALIDNAPRSDCVATSRSHAIRPSVVRVSRRSVDPVKITTCTTGFYPDPCLSVFIRGSDRCLSVFIRG